MPELPEVEVVARGLRVSVLGHTVLDAQMRVPRLRWPLPQGLSAQLAGQRLEVLELTGAAASLQALHERTILEKKFIEDAFIRIDQQLGLSSPSETAAAGDSDEVLAL